MNRVLVSVALGCFGVACQKNASPPPMQTAAPEKASWLTNYAEARAQARHGKQDAADHLYRI